MKKKVSIMVPCYNEVDSLPIFYEEVCRYLVPDYDWELLFINDGSTDGTLSLLYNLYEEDQRVSVVDLSRNYGKESAMLAGFDYASGDAVIIMDADLQDPPSLIPQMLEKWSEGYDDVYARRINRGRESWIRKRLTKSFYHLFNRLSRIDVPENVGDFRLLDRKCVDALSRLRENQRYTKGLYSEIGFRKCAIDFDRGDRVKGSSKWGFWRLFGLAFDGIISHSNAPLRIATIIGSLTSLVAFAMGFFYLFKALIWGDRVSGFPTLVVIILFLGGLQLIALGIIGEYIGRIYIEAKNRPVYNVREILRHE